jgi:hypothetical protein
LRLEPDGGIAFSTTHRARTGRWLGIENRCVVPFVVLRVQQGGRRRRVVCAERNRPLAVFAGIWTHWTSVRKVKEGETANDL